MLILVNDASNYLLARLVATVKEEAECWLLQCAYCTAV